MILEESSSLVETLDKYFYVRMHTHIQEHIQQVSGSMVGFSGSSECRWRLNSDRLNSCSGLHQLCFS